MSKLSQLTLKINSFSEKISESIYSKYSFEFDENANLIIYFADDTKIKLPIVPFRSYQQIEAKKLFIDKILRHLLAWPRRSGKEFFTWNCLVIAAIIDPGLYIIVYPTNVRGRAVLWEGAISLLDNDKSIKFIDMVPKRLISKINNQEMKITLINGSILWIVGSDIDPDKLRGTNPRAMVNAEFAFQDPRVFYNMLPALRQNKGWIIGQSTFDGQNHFYQLMKNNKDDPLWNCRIESIRTLIDENGNQYITDEMVEEDRRAGMPEYLIQQEYYCVADVNEETKYFAHAIKNIIENERIISGIFLPNSCVYAAWDIGVNDCTAITLFQVHQVLNYLEPIVIGYIENNNRDLVFYVSAIRSFCNKYNLTLREHFIPHDGDARKTLGIGLKTTKSSLLDMNEKVRVMPRPKDKILAIQAIRQILYITKFNKENTIRLIDCLSCYSKEYNDKLGTYKDNPKHDWASHGVDSFQSMTLALNSRLISDTIYETVYYG